MPKVDFKKLALKLMKRPASVSSQVFAARLGKIRPQVLLTGCVVLLSLLAWQFARPSAALTNNGVMTALGVPLTESFDTLAASGTGVTWTDNTTIVGWYSTRTTYTANAGSSNSGSLYSFGTGTNSDRALGSVASGSTTTIYNAVKLVNNTGATITALDVSYVGEQWRNGGNVNAHTLTFQYQIANAGTITGANTPSTGWTEAASLNFVSPITSNTAAALDGNAAANRATKTATISVSITPGQEVWLRWVDPDDTGADHGLAVDDLSVTPQGTGGGDALSLNCTPNSFAENAGAAASTCTVTRTGDTTSALTVNLTSSDTSEATVPATVEIPANQTNTTFSVDAVDDVLVDGLQSVTVQASASGLASGTFQLSVTDNDMPSLVAINQIQGSGTTSPLSGSVTTQGVVTARKTNGFFMQTPTGSNLDDGNPNTSEGLFVFTSSAPPAAAEIGNIVTVTGTIADFVPSGEVCSTLNCAPEKVALTELTSPTVTLVSTGNALPAAVVLTAAAMNPAGSIEQLEKYEAMRVSVASLLVVAPTDGNVTETSATSSTDGVFQGVIPANTRPFREAGLEAPEPPPPGGGTIPPIPRYDGNPERLRVDSNATGGAPLEVTTGATVTGLVGVLDYGFRTYTLNPDPASVSPAPVVSGNVSAQPLPAPTASEFTVASFNLERFFDTVNDGNGAPTLTATAFANRLNKASLAIRNILRTPDILAVIEVENLSTLQALANKINTDAGASNPNYVGYLVEGNDPGGIDVGFLVKTAVVTGAIPRVNVVEVVQEGKTATYLNPNTGANDLLNDRPPLRLNAIVNNADGRCFPITVIANHLRSLNDINNPAASGSGTEGGRVRAKRQAQAVYLANLIQARQVANPNEKIIAVGDFNAFQVNDGYADLIGTIIGQPSPDNETVVPNDGVDLVNPNLSNLVDFAAPEDKYSYVFGGNAQVLDHLLANANLIPNLNSFRTGRIDADFPETYRNDPLRPERISDHDAPMAYFAFEAPADLSLTKTHVGSFQIGSPGQYTLTVTNQGTQPQPAGVACGITVTDTLPGNLTLASFSGTGWSCTGTGTANVSCTHPGPLYRDGSLPTLTLTVNVGAGTPTGTNSITNVANVATGGETNTANNSASDPTSVSGGGCPTITVNPANPTLPNGRAGELYSQTFTQTGGTGAASFTVSAGSLPTGLTLNPNGTLGGTPSVFGAFNFTVRATDANSCAGERAYSLTLNPPCTTITVNPASLPNGFQGTAYNQTFTASGGTAPYSFAVTSGSLPGGLSLASGGALTGTPTASGTFNFTVTATDSTGCTGTRSYTVIVSGNGLQFFPLAAPVRLLDTRTGATACTQPNAPVAGQTSLTQVGRNFCGIPANAVALTGNISTINSGGGFLTLYPSDAAQPTVANSTYGVNEVINNVFTVGLGAADGAFKIFAFNTTDVAVDVTGYYAPPATGGLYFHPLPAPVRLLDTRMGATGCVTPGAALPGNADSTQQAITPCTGIPAAARALVGNATTISPQGFGYLTLFPGDAPRPLAASSTYGPGQTVNGPFTVGLAANGEFKIYTFAATDLAVDIVGYYSTEANDANGAGLLFTPLPKPVRLLETRNLPTGCFKPNAPLNGQQEYTQVAQGTCDGVTIPTNARGIVGNATAVTPNGFGFLTLWPSGATRPLVATATYSPGEVTNRHFIVGLGAGDGAFKMYTFATSNLVIDLAGYFAP